MTLQKQFLLIGSILLATSAIAIGLRWTIISTAIVFGLPFLPGLTIAIYKNSGLGRSFLFIGLTWFIIVTGVVIPFEFIDDTTLDPTWPELFRVITAGVSITVLFSIAFTTIYKRKLPNLYNLKYSIIVGLVSVLPGLLLRLISIYVKNWELEETLTFLSIGLVALTWTYLIGRHISNIEKVSS